MKPRVEKGKGNGDGNGNGNKTAELPEKERRALVQRVLWSRELARSKKIRDFLSYVCERAFEDGDAQPHEQEIGHHVFGRPAEFDPHDDNIVRVTACNTRKKLELYFLDEGISEPVILEIPKGKYKPIFRERDADLPEESAASISDVQAKLAVYRRVLVALGACTVAILTVAIWSLAALRSGRQAHPADLLANPAINILWSHLLFPTTHTDIILPDSSLSLFENLEDSHISLMDYIGSSKWMVDDRLAANPKLDDFAQQVARQGLTSMSSVRMACRIAQLAHGDLGRISILRPRDFNMTQMKSDNVVLLGSPRANPWEYLIDSKLHFQRVFDRQAGGAYFEVLGPRSGEVSVYRSEPNVSYSRIAFVPNQANTGSVLSIEGSDAEGTEGGSEFVTSESSMEKLLAVAGKGHGGSMPYFEALLKGSRVGGEASSFSIVAFRLVQPTASGLDQNAAAPHSAAK